MISSVSRFPVYTAICGSTLTILGTYFYNLTKPSRNFDFSYCATAGHDQSLAFKLLNPKAFPTEQDTFSISIPKRQLVAGISDEEILARFTRGFFGGWIFTPERWFFTLTRYSFMDHDGKKCLVLLLSSSKNLSRKGNSESGGLGIESKLTYTII